MCRFIFYYDTPYFSVDLYTFVYQWKIKWLILWPILYIRVCNLADTRLILSVLSVSLK